jgi:hypothetical protein
VTAIGSPQVYCVCSLFFPHPLTDAAASHVAVVPPAQAVLEMPGKSAGNLQPLTGRIRTSRTHSRGRHSTATSGAIICDLMAPFPDCDGTHKRTHGKIGRHLHVWCSVLTPLSSDRRYEITKQCSTAFRDDFAGISLSKSSMPQCATHHITSSRTSSRD